MEHALACAYWHLFWRYDPLRPLVSIPSLAACLARPHLLRTLKVPASIRHDFVQLLPVAYAVARAWDASGRLAGSGWSDLNYSAAILPERTVNAAYARMADRVRTLHISIVDGQPWFWVWHHNVLVVDSKDYDTALTRLLQDPGPPETGAQQLIV